MLMIAFVMIIALARQNNHIKQQYSELSNRMDKTSKMQEFTQRVSWKYASKPFAIPISQTTFTFLNENTLARNKRHLVMVFNQTVCGNCLIEQLVCIQNKKKEFEEKGITLLAVVGIIDEKEKADVMALRERTQFPFAVAFVSTRQVDGLLGLDHAEFYLDSPVYFLLGKDLTVCGVFKPDVKNLQLFVGWIESILST